MNTKPPMVDLSAADSVSMEVDRDNSETEHGQHVDEQEDMDKSAEEVFAAAMRAYDWMGVWWMDIARADDTARLALSVLKSAGLLTQGTGGR